MTQTENSVKGTFEAYTRSVLRALRVGLLIISALFAQNKPAGRAKASDYPVHASIPGLEIGAEYLVHSIPGDNGYYYADDFLVVDVGVFPSSGARVKIASRQFFLIINHGKSISAADAPGMVAGSISPRSAGGFAGQQGQDQQTDPNGAQDGPPKTPYQIVTSAALPEGDTEKPAKGCLFFRFGGRMKTIRSLELIYDPGEGKPKATVPLI